MEGRWISRDPIGEQSDSNLYRFAQNRIIVDNLGLDAPSSDPCAQSQGGDKNPKIEGNDKEVSATGTKKDGDTTATAKGSIDKDGTAKGSAEVKQETGDTTTKAGGSTDSDGNNKATAEVSQKNGETTTKATSSIDDKGNKTAGVGIENKNSSGTTKKASVEKGNKGTTKGKVEIEQKYGKNTFSTSGGLDEKGSSTFGLGYGRDIGGGTLKFDGFYSPPHNRTRSGYGLQGSFTIPLGK